MIVETGRDMGPGSPVLFGVSDDFLERMGLRSVEELPPLAGFMPDTEALEDMEAKLSPNAARTLESSVVMTTRVRSNSRLAAVRLTTPALVALPVVADEHHGQVDEPGRADPLQ